NVPLQILLAGQYAADGDVNEAVRIYQKLAAESPTHAAEIYRGLFAVYKAQARPDEILAQLNEVLSRAGDREKKPAEAAAAAPKARAMLAALRGDGELVTVLLVEMRRQFPDWRRFNHHTLLLLAVLAGRSHRLEDAERLYRGCLADLRFHPELEGNVYG